MAIKKQTTFEGLTYNLDNRDRVAADAALQTFKDAVTTLIGGHLIASGSFPSGSSTAATAAGRTVSGELFVTSSASVKNGSADYLVLCIKK